jgi:hypothetical protein
MNKTLTAAALAATMTFGAVAPALANGAASTRNILIGGAAAAILVTNYNHKVRAKREQQRESTRRQASYRQSFYQRHGYYPTDAQVRSWYVGQYGVSP